MCRRKDLISKLTRLYQEPITPSYIQAPKSWTILFTVQISIHLIAQLVSVVVLVCCKVIYQVGNAIQCFNSQDQKFKHIYYALDDGPGDSNIDLNLSVHGKRSIYSTEHGRHCASCPLQHNR